jgi:hypothetical protein
MSDEAAAEDVVGGWTGFLDPPGGAISVEAGKNQGFVLLLVAVK